MYSKYYGLAVKPFENTPDPKFLFPAKSHREVLASLRYGLDTAKGFILITGDIGTGKTLAIQVLLKHINPDYIVFNIINPKWTFNQLIGHLAKKLGVNSAANGSFEILEALRDKLEKLDQCGRRVVLIIDEAHLLSEKVLADIRLLSNIENQKKKLIQIVLVGQKEILQTLQKSSLQTLKQRIMINRSLAALDFKETELYVRHRLRIAGRQSQLFNKRALILIWKRSRGVPRLINQICDNAMLIGYALDASVIGSKEIKEVIKDMGAGRQSNRASHVVHSVQLGFGSLKWISAVVITILLILVLTDESLINKFVSLNDGSQNVAISQSQPPQSKVNGAVDPIDFGKTPLAAQNKSVDPGVLLSKIGSGIGLKKASGDNNAAAGLSTQSIASFSDTSQNRSFARHRESKLDIPSKPSAFTKKIVRPGESLAKIAKKMYGVTNGTVIDMIHAANPAITNINRIYAGQTIILPLIEREDLIVTGQEGSYHIHYASFYNFEGAKRSARELKDSNEQSFVVQTQQQENTVYRVYCGQYKNRDEARKKLATMTLKHLNFINQ